MGKNKKTISEDSKNLLMREDAISYLKKKAGITNYGPNGFEITDASNEGSGTGNPLIDLAITLKNERPASSKDEHNDALPAATSKKGNNKKPTLDGTAHKSKGNPAIGTKSPNESDALWQTAAASKAKKPKETQVWLDNDLYRKIEMLNIKHGKPVPTKHLVNAILRMFIDEHKSEIQKALKSI